MRRTLAVVVCQFMYIISAAAGDLSNLPETQPAFQEKLSYFIQPGDRLADSVRLLEAHRFVCNDMSVAGRMKHCNLDRGGAMGSREVIHEVWLQYDERNRIKDFSTDVTILPGIDELKH